MKTHTLFVMGLAAALAISAQASQEQLAVSTKEVRAETARTADQLVATLFALNALTSQKEGDLRPAYDKFVAEVKRTQTAADSTRARTGWMSGDGRKYFEDWQATVNSISNKSLQKKGQKRLDAVRASYDKVEASLVQAGTKFAPFLSDLADIQKVLEQDLTAGGVKAIRSTVKSATWNHQFVANAVNKTIKELDNMAKQLSSQAK